jgi:hypothetical protein
LERGLLSLNKYGPITRTAVFLDIQAKEIFNEIRHVMGTLFNLSQGCVRYKKSGVHSVKDAPHVRRLKTTTSPK